MKQRKERARRSSSILNGLSMKDWRGFCVIVFFLSNGSGLGSASPERTRINNRATQYISGSFYSFFCLRAQIGLKSFQVIENYQSKMRPLPRCVSFSIAIIRHPLSETLVDSENEATLTRLSTSIDGKCWYRLSENNWIVFLSRTYLRTKTRPNSNICRKMWVLTVPQFPVSKNQIGVHLFWSKINVGDAAPPHPDSLPVPFQWNDQTLIRFLSSSL